MHRLVWSFPQTFCVGDLKAAYCFPRMLNQVIGLLEQHRAALYLRLTGALFQCLGYLTAKGNCDWSDNARSVFRSRLQNEKLHPTAISEQSVASALSAARKVATNYRPASTCSAYSCQNHPYTDFPTVFKELIEGSDNGFKGIRLDFFKAKN